MATLRERSGAPATHTYVVSRPSGRESGRLFHHPLVMESTVCTASMVLRDIASKGVVSVPAQRSPYYGQKQLPGPPLDVEAILPGGLRYTFDDGGCDHRPDPLALRPCRADLSWRSSSPAGEQSSSSWSTLATRMPGLVAIRVAVAAAVMNSRGSCHSGVALRVFFRARVCAASERCVVLCCSPRGLCVW